MPAETALGNADPAGSSGKDPQQWDPKPPSSAVITAKRT